MALTNIYDDNIFAECVRLTNNKGLDDNNILYSICGIILKSLVV
jgi:hypothetical protein